MGTTLTGTQIQNTYDGLIKTTDNTAISATTKLISDGLGNDTCIKVGTAGTDFLGNVDFSAATVTGLPGGAAGLVSGTGADSMKNADSLVTTPASALGLQSISLGNAACAKAAHDVAIGCGAVTSNGNSISIGRNATNGNSDCSIAIGFNSCVTGWSRLIAIGSGARHDGNLYGGAAIGQDSQAYGPGISIGCNARSGAYINGIAIGSSSCVTANAAVALGFSVTAATADTVTVCALETCVASTPTAGGIIMTDAGSVARRLNITAAGALQIDSTPVGGGGGAAGLVSGTGLDSLKNADSLVTTPAVASGDSSLALGDFAQATAFGTVALGGSSGAAGVRSVSIGFNSSAAGTCSVSIGNNTQAPGISAVAVGTFGLAATCAAGDCSVAVGSRSTALSTCATSLGYASEVRATAACGIAIGNFASSRATRSIAIGGQNNVSQYTRACADMAVALGHGVTATTACTVTSCQYQACVAGKGIIVTSPDGLTTLGIGIDNSGNIVTYTP